MVVVVVVVDVDVLILHLFLNLVIILHLDFKITGQRFIVCFLFSLDSLFLIRISDHMLDFCETWSNSGSRRTEVLIIIVIEKLSEK